MQDNSGSSASELRALCGPRLNTFGPAQPDADHRPCAFFAPKLGAMDRRHAEAAVPDAERWDGQG